MPNLTDSDITLLLDRGVEAVLPNREALAQLLRQRPIKLFLGIDPTGSQLHLGHAVVLRKLQQFVDAGQEVILLIGNGTVKIGDPTGRDKTRPLLTDEVIEENFQTWQAQASKILDFSHIKIVRNGDWFEQMSFGELIKLFSEMTIQQLLERDMFQERIKAGLPIHAHEILYPILQGYDSVVLEVDLEIGGNDQLFNMMAGRTMMRQMKNREKYVLTVPLLVGSDGRKMGKSLGNFIALTEPANQMYGKIMRVADEVLPQYFRLLTDVPETEVADMEHQITDGNANPMEFKKRLARILVTQFHDGTAADEAQAFFEATVQRQEIPAEIPELKVAAPMTVLDLVAQSGAVTSRSEARRLIEQGGVELDGQKLTDPYQILELTSGQVLRVGKRSYFRLQLT